MKYKFKDTYKTISQVVKILNINTQKKTKNQTHTLRYWEKQFKQIKPIKINNRRYYDKKNIDILLKIQYLLKNQGMTINGVKKFLNNNFDEETHKKNFLPYVLFGQIKPVLMQKVNNIFAQECGLYSDKYKVAGRVDCIGEYNGVPSIIDFKTSTKERNDDWNESYYIQASAYAEMFEERTGIEINQIVILVVTEDGIVQEFIKTKHDYLPLLVETIDDFTTHWEKEENELVHSSSNDSAA